MRRHRDGRLRSSGTGERIVLVFDSPVAVDRVLELAVALTSEIDLELDAFIGRFVEAADELPRVGITMGVDKGRLETLVVGGREEYVGRPLNVAARLQASLDRPEHVNRALMSLKLYREITELTLKRLCSETSRSYRNLADGKRLRCFQFDAAFLLSRETGGWRAPSCERLAAAEAAPDFAAFARRMREIVARASAAATSALLTKTPSPRSR